jgi:hypothetical protein
LIDGEVMKLLASTEFVLYPHELTIVSVARSEEETAKDLIRGIEAFSSIIFDVAEVSLVVKTEEWSHLKERFEEYSEEGPYRLITFDIVLDLSVVGYLAAVSARLAEAGVSIYALSTFLRDHILVKDEDATRAVKALRGLIEECRARTE